MDLSENIRRTVLSVDEALTHLLPSLKAEPKIVHEAMRYSVFSGGKRLRPLIMIECFKACGGRGAKEILSAACALEMAHTYSLVHDDLPAMDDDDMRRGKPTCHKAFGEANAILAGDALLTLAFNILARDIKKDILSPVIVEFSEAIGTFGMVGGQAMDIRESGNNIGPKRAFIINRLKTARLFQCASSLGAIIARADRSIISAMAAFGDNLGIAFQIIDDIIDNDSPVNCPGNRAARKNASFYTGKAKKALSCLQEPDILNMLADRMLKRDR